MKTLALEGKDKLKADIVLEIGEGKCDFCGECRKGVVAEYPVQYTTYEFDWGYGVDSPGERILASDIGYFGDHSMVGKYCVKEPEFKRFLKSTENGQEVPLICNDCIQQLAKLIK